MERLPSAALLLLSLVAASLVAFPLEASKVYIVYLGSSPQSMHSNLVSASHHQMLASVLDSLDAAKESMVYSYTRSFNGFAARISPDHAAALSGMPEVISVFPNKKNILHTTRSWQFLGLEDTNGDVPEWSLWQKANFGQDVIIGSLDTGVWPESQSYSDNNFTQIPEKWNGTCVSGTAFNSSNCNRKLIGARFYIDAYEAENGPLNETATGEFRSPRDAEGHGTHTSSTAGGEFVVGANALGFANGTAKGGAPYSRIAIYKVCWPGGCYDADILAALDDGIQDGVNIFTLSLGGSPPLPPLYQDGIAIGAFHAVQQGITVICSAGNAGPSSGSVTNVAPWIITVAASSIDRDFTSYAILGNYAAYEGESLSEYKLKNRFYPLVSGGDIKAASADYSDSLNCVIGSLDPAKAKGKIVACKRGVTGRVSKGEAVLLAGGAGMILANTPDDGEETIADPHVLPATHVGARNAGAIFAYLNSSSSRQAKLTSSTTVLDVKPAPVMAAFSSQGPNTLIPDLLKPDITAPGLNILAAYTGATSPTGISSDKRVVKFNIISGTSMSCPHVAGISALLKGLHPDWSPAAIKSAILTTASLYDNEEQPIYSGDLTTAGPFNYGAGHINPNAAADPGLLYDATPEDYVLFLCSLNYTSSSIAVLTGTNFTCPQTPPTVTNFNYPSVAISALNGSLTVTRTVTNVGSNSSSYEVYVRAPTGISVEVQPSKLDFIKDGEKQSFQITFTALNQTSGYKFGYFIWNDGTHLVKSSIVVQTVDISTVTTAQGHSAY
ncbi:hypothetical protein O6H91_03G114400 [Diphasiastrum complanatum]|uniref:Uncharacterized protein n=1 Tax=Diphasiastrum complanatum TaxID=34168 RepID=A0ACC2EAN2_DIPCM|nr:hypothetical protein O6H91_03G114400 [Diphasiastrum complanatum]